MAGVVEGRALGTRSLGPRPRAADSRRSQRRRGRRECPQRRTPARAGLVDAHRPERDEQINIAVRRILAARDRAEHAHIERVASLGRSKQLDSPCEDHLTKRSRGHETPHAPNRRRPTGGPAIHSRPALQSSASQRTHRPRTLVVTNQPDRGVQGTRKRGGALRHVGSRVVTLSVGTDIDGVWGFRLTGLTRSCWLPPLAIVRRSRRSTVGTSGSFSRSSAGGFGTPSQLRICVRRLSLRRWWARRPTGRSTTRRPRGCSGSRATCSGAVSARVGSRWQRDAVWGCSSRWCSQTRISSGSARLWATMATCSRCWRVCLPGSVRRSRRA